MRAILLSVSVLLIVMGGPAAAQICNLENDVTGDGVFNFDDPKALLNYLFLDGPPLPCLGQADANDDGAVNIADPVFMLDALTCSAATVGDVDGSGTLAFADANFLLEYLFLGGPEPVPCLAVADVNGNGSLNIADAVVLINTLPCPPLLAGDANGDEELDVKDIDHIGNYLFNSGPSPLPCLLAGDANGDGAVSLLDMVFIGQILGERACAEAMVGDVNGTDTINQADVTYLLAYLFEGGPDPTPCDDVADVNNDGGLDAADAVSLISSLPCPPHLPGDANSDGRLGLADLLLVINYLFFDGPAPFPCDLAGDINQDGSLGYADVIGYLDLF